MNADRRTFLKAGLAAGGGMVLGFFLPAAARPALADNAPAVFAPNAWIRIAPDELITLVVAKSEMGQGVYTSMPMLLAEELEVDIARVRTENAPPSEAYVDPLLGLQATGGSTSVRSGWKPLREAGAAARMMLIAAAAEAWKIGPEGCRAENGQVIHPDGKQRLSYGRLAEAAARQPVPEKILLKDPKAFRYLGKPVARRDGPAKIDGSAVFGLDVKLPGLLTALFLRCPVFGGKPRAVEAGKAMQVKGVKRILQVGDGVAVVAENFWAAKKGRDALQVEWDEGALAGLDSAAIERRFEEAAAREGAVARHDGDAGAALKNAAKIVEAAYFSPFAAHATMEPMNCTVDLQADRCEIWVGTQAPAFVQATATKLTGLPAERIKVNVVYLGGGFGRRFEQDFVVQAVDIAKQAGAPVKLVWTREDDMQHDVYRPASLSKLRAALDAEGRALAWEQRIVSPSIMKRAMPEDLQQDGKLDPSSVEGAANHLYGIPNIQVDYVMDEPGVPVGFWRSVGNSQNGFVVESFVDELAHAAGQDPLKYRLSLLDQHPRQQAVLKLAAAKAGWGRKRPKGIGLGIAAVNSFGSYVAEAVEATVSADGGIKVKKVVCAIDCGVVVNPDTIEAQIQGAVIYALTAALKGPITIKNGRAEQSNFHDYPLLRLDETPSIEVHIVASGEAPGGVGEPGVPPLAAALGNALFAATGKRLRRLPFVL
jgi:isoquinoline 1-oxidoreductase beta subunit